jgi:hypothetical protein
MVKVVFTFDVAPEKQSEYLKATIEKIKPRHEANGCQSYDVWQVEGENTFIKEMLFPDSATKDRVMGIDDDETKAVKTLWRSFITDFSVKTCVLKT